MLIRVVSSRVHGDKKYSFVQVFEADRLEGDMESLVLIRDDVAIAEITDWTQWSMVDGLDLERLEEPLADLCHQQWSGWMRHLFLFGTKNDDGTFTVAADKVARWVRQMGTDYTNLPGEEQDSDRKEARKFIDLLTKHMTVGD